MATIDLIDPREYDAAIELLRKFFRRRGFIEVPVQHRTSIMAACEDPLTLTEFVHDGELWPMPQTGQMWLEYELLSSPDVPGYYCISTSFRNEPNPIPGRHDFIFPMFEFETHGDMDTLITLETELLTHCGFASNMQKVFRYQTYTETACAFGVKEITPDHEQEIWQKWGHEVFFLTDFPQYTSPFWNMKTRGDSAKKIDVVLYGMETIGSAERSSDPDEMRRMFHTISGGMYAQTLYSRFGRNRVEERLENFLALPMIPRCGGGIGMTRMIRALKLAKIIPSSPSRIPITL